MVSLAVLGTWNLEILQKQNDAIWLANKTFSSILTFPVTLKEETFAGRNFRGSEKPRNNYISRE